MSLFDLNNLFLKASDGDLNAMRVIAVSYKRGKGVEKNLAQFFEWINKSAKNGDIKSLRLLADAYKNGIGTKKDLSKYISTLEIAASFNDTVSIMLLAKAYMEAIYVEQNLKKYFALVKKAAKLGDLKAIEQLARAYKDGTGVKKNIKEFENWIHKAISRNDPEAMARLGIELTTGNSLKKDIEKGFYWLKKAAGLRSSIARIWLFMEYESGVNVPKDCDRALAYALDASNAGDTAAMGLLALGYRDGTICFDIDLEKSLYWFERAAKLKSLDLTFQLAVSYLLGSGFEKDVDKYLYWIERAAEYGSLDSMIKLGLEYQSGVHVSKDDDKFLSWMKKAALEGSAKAMRILAVYYRDKNDSENYLYWIDESIKEGDEASLLIKAISYLYGHAVEENPAIFRELLTLSASKGRTDAMYLLALAYRAGIGGYEKSTENYLYWVERSSDGGDTEAMVHLARFYKEDEEHRDLYKFRKLMKKAASEGDPSAMRYLAKAYKLGDGIRKNKKWYQYWALEAAKNGQVESMYEYAWISLDDNTLDIDERHKGFFEWMNKAANKNYTHALFSLGQAYVEGKIIESDLEKASEYFLRLQKQDQFLGFVAQGLLEIAKLQPDYDSLKLSALIDGFNDLIIKVNGIKKERHEIDIEKQKSDVVAHFTSFQALNSMLRPMDSGYNFNIIRLYNAAYMNDPQEGRVLIDNCSVLKGMFDFEKNHEQHTFKWASEEYTLFLGSFTYMKPDRLDLWRAYGSDGEGFSIVIPLESFSSQQDRNKIFESFNGGTDVNEDQENESSIGGQDIVPKLYRVRYADENQSDDCYLTKTCKNLKPLLENITSYLTEFDLAREHILSIVKVVLSDILYLYKNSEYKTESEVRIVVAEKISSDRVKADERNPGRLFVETSDILFKNFGSKIIIGPKHNTSMEYFLNIKYLVDRGGYSKSTAIQFSEILYR